ncbi:MAG: helix-turn-helix domain-containing protein [Actinomycetota bacterium]
MSASRQPLEPIRLKDGTIGAGVPPDICGLLARLIVDYGRLYRKDQGIPLTAPTLYRIRDELDRISRLDSVISSSGNEKGDRQAPAAELLSTTEAAQRLKRSKRRIQQLAGDGDLPGARKIGRDWAIPSESIDWWLAETLSLKAPEAG